MELINSRHGFGPVVDSHSQILILGSFPSVKSREQTFFYMHPQNRFWLVLSAIFKVDFTHESIEGKIKLLHQNHIALYDVVEECEISGSKDTSIQEIVPADIHSILKGTDIKKIYLNGKKATQLFHQYFEDLKPMATGLPSTSPANAAYSLIRLIEEWQTIGKNIRS